MKKLLILALSMMSMVSCYNTRMIVGNISPTDPVIKVNTVWNHHLIYGLVPLDNATMKTQEYIENQPNYVVRTYTSFLNALVSGLTWGIYTPTSTAYYLPISAFNANNVSVLLDAADGVLLELDEIL